MEKIDRQQYYHTGIILHYSRHACFRLARINGAGVGKRGHQHDQPPPGTSLEERPHGLPHGIVVAFHDRAHAADTIRHAGPIEHGDGFLDDLVIVGRTNRI